MDGDFGGATKRVPIDGVSPSVALGVLVVSRFLEAGRGFSWRSTLGGKSPSIRIKVAMLGGSLPLPSEKEVAGIAVAESTLPNDCARHSILKQVNICFVQFKTSAYRRTMGMCHDRCQRRGPRARL